MATARTVNLYQLLADHPLADGDALVHTIDASHTKGAIVARVHDLADRLDVDADQPVAVVAEGVEMLVGMFACWREQCVFVPVNPRTPRPDLDVAAVVSAGAVEHRRCDVVHEAGTAFVLWTSGTTGRPKPVLHSHEAYLEIIDRVLEPLRAKSSARQSTPSPNLIPVSMALNAGIYNALFGLRAGAPLVMMNRFATGEFATLVERHAVRSTVLPPAAMAMLSDDTTISALAPLRYVRSITAPLSPFQARRFTDRFGVTVLNGYGQAEIGEVIGWTAAHARAHPEKVGAIGRPHPGVDIRIDEPDGNGVGELLVRPPNTATDLDPDRLTYDGFVRTGDLALVDDDGFVWIEGRTGDVINRGGNKVFPGEVEEILLSVRGVRDAAVVAAPDPRLGEVPVAFITGDPGTDPEEVCRAHLVPYKVPVRFELLDRLPRNEAGKVLRQELVARLVAEATGP